MFSLFKKNPLHEELKRAKKRQRTKDKQRWKENKEERKERIRTRTFVNNGICPECGQPVKSEHTTDNTNTTDNHYWCTKCKFEVHLYADEDSGGW